MSTLLTKGETFKDEYCCTVVRIGALTPVEGSDFLAKTDILGTQIVVRKDMVHEGDIMFYAANETALNERFLSVNNQFEIGCRELNSNYPEIKKIMDEYDEKYRNEADELRAKRKAIKSQISSHTLNAAKLNKKVAKLDKDIEKASDKVTISQLQQERDIIKGKADEQEQKALARTAEVATLANQIETLVKNGAHLVDKAKEQCGFFGKYGRVRCITLRGEPSFGYVFSKESMAKYCPEIENENLDELLNEDFDTVNGELFVKAYVPPIKVESRRGSRSNKANKKLSMFDRIVEGEFAFHYDTEQLKKNMFVLDPDTLVYISVKLHGTSSIIGKVHVKEPKRIAPHKWLWNKFVDITHLFRSTRFIDYNVVYGPVYSSRTVIKNRYINKTVNQGYYSTDIWSEYGDIIYPYLDDGMIVYGEIVGYETGTQKMIQKFYDYGCQEGENRIMFYRISTTNEDGTKKEWEIDEVHNWTLNLIERMKGAGDENYKRIHPIDILYYGTLGALYPEVNVEEHWHEEVLNNLKNDKQTFGMEELEPLCKYHEVPREGFCLRIENDPINRCWKLKTVAFALKEALMVDAGEVDIEMQDAYGDVAQTEKNTTVS